MGSTAWLVAAALLLSACNSDPYAGQVRGHGLQIADRSAVEATRIYRVAAAATFNDGTTLLLNPTYLPRGAGWDGGDRMPFDVVSTLRGQGAVAGTCAPPNAGRNVPVCDAS